MQIFGSSRNQRSLRRAGVWVLLAAFLLLQARAAIAGCLIDAGSHVDEVVAATTDGDDAADADAADPCCPHDNVPARGCAEKCAPSASVSTTPTDHVLAVVQIGFGVPPLVVDTPSGNATPVVRRATAPPGSPPYLRFLRLLN